MSMKEMKDYLLANTVLPEPNRLEMDLKMLLDKEKFSDIIKEKVTNSNKENKND
jgi:hypothetical protein